MKYDEYLDLMLEHFGNEKRVIKYMENVLNGYVAGVRTPWQEKLEVELIDRAQSLWGYRLVETTTNGGLTERCMVKK